MPTKLTTAPYALLIISGQRHGGSEIKGRLHAKTMEVARLVICSCMFYQFNFAGYECYLSFLCACVFAGSWDFHSFMNNWLDRLRCAYLYKNQREHVRNMATNGHISRLPISRDLRSIGICIQIVGYPMITSK